MSWPTWPAGSAGTPRRGPPRGGAPPASPALRRSGASPASPDRLMVSGHGGDAGSVSDRGSSGAAGSDSTDHPDPPGVAPGRIRFPVPLPEGPRTVRLDVAPAPVP